ncbi:MAG: YceD family protein [Phocaeicola sp.]
MKADLSTYELDLDNQFFVDLDTPEVQKGKLTVFLEVKKTFGLFTLSFEIDGVVKVSCDRCLDDMELPVSVTEQLKVKLGAEFSEEGDIVIVPEEDGYINVAWFIYEFIALGIPIKHVHAPGKCNKSMVGKLGKHLRTASDDESDDDDDAHWAGADAETESLSDESKEIDPRWNELKKIIDNN